MCSARGEYLSDMDMSFLVLGIKENNFSRAGCQRISKGSILYDRVVDMSSSFYVFEHPFYNFSAGRYCLEGNILKLGKTFFLGTSRCKFESSIPRWEAQHSYLGYPLPHEYLTIDIYRSFLQMKSKYIYQRSID